MWDATNHSYCQKMKGKKSPGRSTKKEKKVSPSVSDSQWVILDNLFEVLNNNWNDLLSSLAMIFKMRLFKLDFFFHFTTLLQKTIFSRVLDFDFQSSFLNTVRLYQKLNDIIDYRKESGYP